MAERPFLDRIEDIVRGMPTPEPPHVKHRMHREGAGADPDVSPTIP